MKNVLLIGAFIIAGAFAAPFMFAGATKSQAETAPIIVPTIEPTVTPTATPTLEPTPTPKVIYIQKPVVDPSVQQQLDEQKRYIQSLQAQQDTARLQQQILQQQQWQNCMNAGGFAC